MYTYTATITYTGNNAFVLFMWDRITRRTGQWRISFEATQAEANSIRNAGLTANFVFSNITRVPVPVPENIP